MRLNKIMISATSIIALTLCLVFSGCSDPIPVRTKLALQFKNLVGPGSMGAMEIECLNGKLVAYQGSLIVKQGLESGCAKSLKILPPKGNHSCPGIPSTAATVEIHGVLNNKPFRGTYKQGNCQASMKAWNTISDLWVQQGPELVIQKVFVFPTSKTKIVHRVPDKEFAVRSAAGQAESCLLLLSYRPLESQGCAMIVPAPAPAYVAIYLTPNAVNSLLGASASKIIKILNSGQRGKPPIGFPGN